MSGNQLSSEQLRRIEENRQKALLKKASRLNEPMVQKKNGPINVCKPTNTTLTSQAALSCSKSYPVKPSSSVVTFGGNNGQCSSGNQTKSVTVTSSSNTSTEGSGQNANVNQTTSHKNQLQTLSKNFYSTVNNSRPPKKTTCINDRTMKKSLLQMSQFSSGAKSGSASSSRSRTEHLGQCTLLSRSRFAIDIPFNQKLIDIFKVMPTKNYNAVSKVWNFHLSDYDKLWKAVKSVGMENEIEPLPKAVTTTFRQQRHGVDKPRTAPEVNLNSVDTELVEALMPFQREGVGYAVERQGRVLIADDMGLGKTFQAVCVACYYRAEWPLLIITPSSLRFAWKEMLQNWLPSIDPESINVVQKVKESGTSGLVNILSYDLMTRKAAELKLKKFNVVIMDESHFLKNFKSARTKAAIPILKNATRVILLSGTPALSRPSELYVQVNSIDSSLFPVFHEFGLRYCNARQNKWGWDYSGSSNMTELQLLLEERIMVRRTKKEVLSQLPSKSRQVVVLDPALVNTNSKSLQSYSKGLSNNKGGHDRSALLQYFNETGLAKMKAIRDYVIDLLECGCKFLVFAHHQTVLDMLCELLIDKKIQYIRIDGSTSVEKRQESCCTFQTNDECVAAVLSITAANAGLTLTAASLVIFAELFWNPGILMQAEDRVHRIGQKESVTIRYLIAKNTADDYIWPLIQEKMKVLGKAGLSKDNFKTADVTNFKDPRQKDILSYFEHSFIEDDMDDEALKHITEMEEAASDDCCQTTADENYVEDNQRCDENMNDNVKASLSQKRKASQSQFNSVEEKINSKLKKAKNS